MSMTQKDKQGMLMIGGGVAAIAALLIATQIFKAEERDENGCVSTSTPTSTVVLLDHSEGMSEQTVAEIRDRVVRFVSGETATDERVYVYAVSESSSNALRPMFEMCKLPSEGNQLTENEKSIKLKFERDFMAGLETALASEFEEGSTSPIAQAIADLSLTRAMKADHPRLLVFSDMIENSAALSMYQCSPSEDPKAIYRSNNRGALERPTFKNAEVSLNVIPRRGLPEGTLHCRTKFWPWFFGDNAGPEAEVTEEFLPG